MHVVFRFNPRSRCNNSSRKVARLVSATVRYLCCCYRCCSCLGWHMVWHIVWYISKGGSWLDWTSRLFTYSFAGQRLVLRIWLPFTMTRFMKIETPTAFGTAIGTGTPPSMTMAVDTPWVAAAISALSPPLMEWSHWEMRTPYQKTIKQGNPDSRIAGTAATNCTA